MVWPNIPHTPEEAEPLCLLPLWTEVWLRRRSSKNHSIANRKMLLFHSRLFNFSYSFCSSREERGPTVRLVWVQLRADAALLNHNWDKDYLSTQLKNTQKPFPGNSLFWSEPVQFVRGCHYSDYCRYKLLINHWQSTFEECSAGWVQPSVNPRERAPKRHVRKFPTAGKASAGTHACIRQQRIPQAKNPLKTRLLRKNFHF